jgi:hypothetical protein
VARPAFQVADVFRRHGEAYREANAGHLDRCQRRVMAAIEACRTAALGGHVRRCPHCGLTEISYCSCRDRHCPTCQGSAARAWLEARQADLLPVEYFHVVFTLPQQVAAVAYQNKAVVHGLLFEAAAETLKTIAGDSEHLGAEIGFTAVHVGPDADPPPTRALHCAGWRTCAGWCELGRVPARVLPT